MVLDLVNRSHINRHNNLILQPHGPQGSERQFCLHTAIVPPTRSGRSTDSAKKNSKVSTQSIQRAVINNPSPRNIIPILDRLAAERRISSRSYNASLLGS